MSTAGIPLAPNHKHKAERENINGHLLCKACPEEDGVKGKWKPEGEFYVKPHMSGGRSPRCKECMKEGRYIDKGKGGIRGKRKRKPQPATTNETVHSLSTLMARNLWDSSLNFERVQA